MDFSYGNSGINNSIAGNNVNGMITSVSQNMPNSSVEGTNAVPIDIMQAKPGQAFTGEISNMSGETVTISLGNGQSFNAKLEADVDIFMGQKLNFLIKSNNGSTIEIKPLYDTLGQNPAVEKAITESGIENNIKNANIILAMIREGMSIDKQSVTRMLRSINANPQADIATIVKMNKLGIPVNENNVAQFENYQNYEHRIVKDMDGLANQIPEVLKEIIDSGNKNEGLLFNNKIIDILNGKTQDTVENTTEKNVIIDENGNKIPLNNSEVNNDKINQSNGEKSYEILHNSQTETENGEKITGNQSGEKNLNINSDEKYNQTVNSNEINMFSKKDADGNVVLSGKENVADETKMPQDSSRVENTLSEQQRQVLAGKLEGFGIEKEVIDKVKTGDIETKELLNLLKENVFDKGIGLNKNETFKEKVTELIASKEYALLLKNAIKSEWLLKPSDVEKMEDMKEYYNKLNTQTKELMAAFESFGKENSQGYKNASNMRDNLEFMNQLNRSYTYMQIPIQFSNEDAHSDLYVYTNKKNLKNYDGNLSVMLHLDMEVLGMTDVYLEMSPGKQVTAKFSMKNKESISIVEENMEKLIAALEEKGYKIKANVTKQEKEPDFVEDFLEKDKVMTSMKRFSFDVRM